MDERYQKGKIYRIVCNVTGEVYVGSTITTLGERLSKHKTKMTCCSSEIIQRGNYRIELIEPFPCRNKQELLWRERYYIEQNECINKMPPIVTEEEYKERQRIKCTKYNAAHREELNKYASEKIQCECGRAVARGVIAHHRKTKIHLELISQQTTNEATTQDQETHTAYQPILSPVLRRLAEQYPERYHRNIPIHT